MGAINEHSVLLMSPMSCHRISLGSSISVVLEGRGGGGPDTLRLTAAEWGQFFAPAHPASPQNFENECNLKPDHIYRCPESLEALKQTVVLTLTLYALEVAPVYTFGNSDCV